MREYVYGDFQDLVAEKADISAEGGEIKIWTFAHEVMPYEGEHYPALIDMSDETDGVDNEAIGMEKLCQHIISQQTQSPGSRIFVITDLADDLDNMFRKHGIAEGTVKVINPGT
jgi:hypothetical protein